MKILLINAGSSSLKYQLLDMKTEKLIVKGNCEKIGLKDPIITLKCNGKETNLMVQKIMKMPFKKF